MIQETKSVNPLDANGNPSGGAVHGVGLSINWQNGALSRGTDRQPPNGAFVETVIQAAKQRLEFYQTASDARFVCRENAEAIEHLTQALNALEKRTARREALGVEGTHTPE